MKTGRMPRAGWFLPSLTVFALMATASCTPVDPDERTDRGDDAALLPDTEEFSPALEFDRTGAYEPGSSESSDPDHVELYGPAVVHAGEHALSAHDVVNDEQLWSVSPEYGEVDSRSVMIAEHGEDIVAVGAFGTLRPGSGTAQDSRMHEVLAVDLVSGETLWHETTETDSMFSANVVGLEGDSLILGGAGTIALDMNDGSHLWSDNEVEPWMVGGDGVVVATSDSPDAEIARNHYHRLYGIDAEAGDRVWETWEEGEHETGSRDAEDEYSAFLDTDPDPGEMVMEHGSLNGYAVIEAQPTGADRFYIIASSNTSARGGMVALFDTNSGIADFSITHDPLTSEVETPTGWGEATCSYDQEENLACWVEGYGDAILANIDAEAGEVLWHEKFSSDSERRFTEPVSAWHGVLYARVEGEPIILDLEDGSDLVLDPGAAPDLTNGTVAVEAEVEDNGMGPDHSTLRVFPVTG